MSDHQLMNDELGDRLRDDFDVLKSEPPEDVRRRMLERLQAARESCELAAIPAQQQRRSWRPRLQFSLRTILALMVMASIPMFVVLRPYLSQSLAASQIERLGGRVELVPSGPQWFRERFGSGVMRDVVLIDVADSDDPAAYMSEVLQCPKLEVLVVGGDAFDDQWLAKLGQLKDLKGLVLDSTNATQEGVEALRQAIPKLAVRQSWRRIEESLGDAASYETGTHAEMPPWGLTVSFEWPMQPHAGPSWLRERAGNRHFKDLIFVTLTTSATDEDLDLLAKLDFQALTLQGSPITDEGLAKLSAHTSGQVTLNYMKAPCKFTDRGLQALLEEKKVYNLMLHGVPLAESDLGFLKDQPQLQHLGLANAELTDDHLRVLSDLAILRELTLTESNVTDEGLPHLNKLPKLRRLWIGKSYVTREGLLKFLDRSPQCRVMWSDPGSGIIETFRP